MSVYFITGKLGSGKSLVSVSRIDEALRRGVKVATNLDIYLEKMFFNRSKHTYIRLPDKPTRFDMESIGIGNATYDETKNGLIVLDELGTWLNSRSWNDKTRAPLLDWFLHARKKGWDVIFIIQDVSIVDKQFRETLCEMTAFCRRLDRLQVPLIGPLIKFLTGYRIPLPRVHFANVVYGDSPTDYKIDNWVYTGTHLYNAYDTKQVFRDDYQHAAYSILPPCYVNRQKQTEWSFKKFMRLTKIYWKKFSSPIALTTGLLLGISITSLVLVKQKYDSIEVNTLPAEPAQETKPLEEKQDPYLDRIKGLVSQLYISGTRTSHGSTTYELGNINDDELKVHYTDIDLARMGLIITRRGQCHLDVKVGHEKYPLFCLKY